MAKTKKQSKKKDNKEIKIILTAAIAILLELCTLNVLGKAGGWVGYGLFGLFGLMAYVFPILAAAAFIYYFLKKEKLVSKLVCGAIFFVCLCAFVHLITYKVFLNETLQVCLFFQWRLKDPYKVFRMPALYRRLF